MKANITSLFLFLFLFSNCKKEDNITQLEGYAFGTTFHITYADSRDYTKQIDSLFHLVNKSLSTYIPNSDISKINKGDTSLVVDAYFKEVFEKSNKIYKETGGVFDPTIGTLVNAWGFGPKKELKKLDSAIVKDLMQRVGFDKVRIINGKVSKDNDSTYFDFNAIAKGYAVDIAGRYLESKGISNYLVEIGGEIRARGTKKDTTQWKVGIEEPHYDGTRSIMKMVLLKNESMATSGNYRKFKVDTITGKKYTHILDTKTGYPSTNNILSMSIAGPIDCADVDGYATALMAMPLEKTKQFLTKHQELRAYIVYSDKEGKLLTYQTPNF